MAEQSYVAGTTTDYIQPAYNTQTAQNFAGGINDLLGNNGYINNTMSNWYNQNPGQGALGQYSQWDPNKQQGMINGQLPVWDQSQQSAMMQPFTDRYSPVGMQQFLNPYTRNVVNEQARLSNQNLFENVIPGLNSTFTGNGQFGSSRNADFMNRAIRDQQYNLMGQQGKTLFDAQNAANQQYADWTKMNNQGEQFGASQYAHQQDLAQQAKQFGAGQYKDWTNMGLSSSQQDLANWLQQANFPLSSLGQVGQMYGNLKTSQPETVTTSSSGPTNPEKIAGTVGGLSQLATPNNLNTILNWFGG